MTSTGTAVPPATSPSKRKLVNEAAERISSTTKFLNQVLTRRQANGNRVMSPNTQEHIEQLLDRLSRDSEGSDEVQSKLTQVHALEMIEYQIAARLEAHEKYKRDLEELDALRKEAWLVGFGDYYAATLGQLRAAFRTFSNHNKARVKNGKIPIPLGGLNEVDTRKTVEFFLGSSWRAINRILEDEDEDPSSGVYIPALKEMLRTAPHLEYSVIRQLITLYASRNDVVHHHIKTLADKGQYSELSVLFCRDLHAVDNKLGMNDQEREVTRAAIWATLGLYFKTFEMDIRRYSTISTRIWPEVNGRPIPGPHRPQPPPPLEGDILDSEDEDEISGGEDIPDSAGDDNGDVEHMDLGSEEN